MKNLITKIALLFLVSSVCCLAAGKKGKPLPPEPPDTHSLVASITPGAAGTTVIAINGDSPFAATTTTTVVIDDKAAKVTDIKVGMKVISHTAADSSMPEIDLKTVPASATPAKKNKKAAQT